MLASSPDKRSKEQRFWVFAGIAVAGFGLIGVGLLRLQVQQYDHYRRLAQENRIRLEVLRAPRGAIFDRHGVLLADNHPSFNIVFRPLPAESLERARQVVYPGWVARVGWLTGVDSATVSELVRSANRTGQSAMLRRNAPFEVLAAVEESRAELPGLDVVVEPMRRYPFGILAAHLLGYAGEINDRELAERATQDYRPGDLIGRSGVERSYEHFLRGRDGAEYVVVNAMGKRVSTLTEGPPLVPEAGSDVNLTLDLRVQQALEEAMAEVGRGAAVAIDPRDGEILGMVSRPAFDPNEFSQGLSFARWRELSEGGGANPLFNRAIQGTYPPGSTFKIVTMLAALRSGVSQPGSRYAPCSGAYFFGGRSFGCWKHEGHGSLDFPEAIQHSCDVYFYQVGLKLGLPPLEATARSFGLGGRTGIDLPQERQGLIPSPAWYDKRWGVGKWRKGLLLNLAIGQGELLVTPLQLALLAAQAGTGGHAIHPHVVQSVAGSPQFGVGSPVQPGPSAEPAVWAAVHQGLEEVVEAGTATLARVPNLRVGGKTGTAQNPHGKDHALFVCYAPAEDPVIGLAFVIENSGHGGSVAAPMAGHVLRRLFLPDSLQRDVKPVRLAVDSTAVVRGD